MLPFFSVSSMQVLISNISSISGKTHSFILRFCWIFSGILIFLFCAVVLGDVFHLSLFKTVGIWWSSDGNFVSRFPLLMSVFHMTPLFCWGPSATLLETLKFSAFYCLAISYPLSVANYGGKLSTFYFLKMYLFCHCMYTYMCHGMCFEDRGQLCGLGPLPLLHGSRNQRQVIRLGGKCYWVVSLAGPLH